MDIKFILLGFLSRQSLTGYGLKKRFAISFSFFSGVSYGSIYPALKKMEKEGLVTQQQEIRDGAPNRKVYSITPAGRKTFVDALKEPSPWEMPKNTFLTRLFFFAHLLPEERRAAARDHLDSLKETQRQIKSLGPEIEARADVYQLQCYHFGLRFYRDVIRNLSQVVRTLEHPSDRKPFP